MTIKELFEAAVEFEESLMAHTIITLLQEGKITTDDDADILERIELDYEKIKKAVERNDLGINPIKLFSLKINQHEFVWIYASSAGEAVRHFLTLFQQKPINCHEFNMDWDVVIGDRSLTFREYRNEFKDFPCIAGYFDRRRDM